MRILAIDTATERGSVAVTHVEGAALTVLAEAAASVDSRHGETLLPLIEDVMRRAQLHAKDLGLIAVGLGPGSFTGVRIGVATAKGLSLALQIPLFGLGTLELIARGVAQGPSAKAGAEDDVLVVIDAKKTEVFAARYRGGVEIFGPIHGRHEAVAHELDAHLSSVEGAPILAGRGARDPRFVAAFPRILSHAEESLDHPEARVLAVAALERFRAGGKSDLSSIVPRYVRGADATPSALVPSVAGTKSER